MCNLPFTVYYDLLTVEEAVEWCGEPVFFPSVCRQQPCPYVDSDAVQRDDLHSARLHALSVIQDPVLGGDRKPWQLLLWK